MKKVFMFMTLSLLTVFSIGCSSDDNDKPIIEPPIETNYEKAIMKEWVFDNYQLLDKDRKVVKEFDAMGQFECKKNIWNFKEIVNEDNVKQNARVDLSYITDPDTNECIEHRKVAPYSIKDKELITALVNDGDQMMVYFFEIREIGKEQMLLIRKDYELTEEEAIKYNYPKEAKYLQYKLKLKK
ncbi:hypothetical protein [Myroides marinus]|nr:hypothetical protein [Myroides marinus]